MKKIGINLLAVLSLCVGLVACESKKEVKNVALDSTVDSLSYALGVQRGDQILITYPSRKGLEIANMDQFIQGFVDEMYSTKVVDKNYELGIETAKEMKKMLTVPVFPADTTARLNKDALVDGMVATLLEKSDTKMTTDEAKDFMQKMVARIEREMHASAIEAEEKFLAENKTKEGVMETPSGLQYKIITEGKGEIPGDNTMVKVHFIGSFTDGTVFGNSHEQGKPVEFNTSGGMIEAWKEATKMMPVGSKWIIYAPSKLAYSGDDSSGIPPYSTLIFEMELLDIVKETEK